jgi:ribosome-binding factor A
MEESKRQKQVAGLINKELSDIFLLMGLNVIGGGMISISKVTITPDLYEARIYLSFFKIDDQAAMLQKIKDRAWEIKKELTSRVRNQLRSMPQLHFFIDDTLDYVFKMEELFKTIQNDQPGEEKKEG